ncbi:glycosyltransferase family 4 protein [Persicimonas caeni]|uniref:Glycosyltransferase family 4 protein n=1 Tax=Persicimonas caeni TaxID=2292766 RepID=A0A4Y6PXX3_PERCE|nr:glycosyltransferase family 1 protein [Persicimonas caeni]QDG52595.1 glycosyltransferase family 4 protein [Persicimonas caeni]QED33817.1 glycosyltransferase family 4 protein [Persicimonas caeni]
MARIYLDARNITETPAGVARYALSLIPELVRQAPQHEFIVIRHSSNREPIEVLGYRLKEVFVDRPIDNMENFLLGAGPLKRVFREHGAPDIYHDLFHILPVGLRRGRSGASKIVVTLHDLVWIDYPHQSQPTWLQAEAIRAFASAAIPYALKTADHVICVSEPTAQRARPWLRRGHFTTVYHGVTPEFFRPAPPPTGVLPKLVQNETPYIVAIGNGKPYKNLNRLIDAFARVRPELDAGHLVLVGNCEALRPQIEWSQVAEHVTLTGFLSDDELRQVLGHARMFVFPSLVEGFGLPVLEAMAMGVPTVVSDLEPMRTVAANGGLKVDPHNTGEMADAIRRVMTHDSLYNSLVDRGQRRAAEFRWPLTARKTLQVYSKVLSS